jgi:hypothetical protein
MLSSSAAAGRLVTSQATRPARDTAPQARSRPATLDPTPPLTAAAPTTATGPTAMTSVIHSVGCSPWLNCAAKATNGARPQQNQLTGLGRAWPRTTATT